MENNLKPKPVDSIAKANKIMRGGEMKQDEIAKPLQSPKPEDIVRAQKKKEMD